jgi:hypothetical protein
MTTDALEQDGQARPSGARRLGAIAGVTPVAMFVAWTAISGWGGTAIEFVQGLAIIAGIALVAGWIVGGRSGRSIRSVLLDTIAYPVVAWLLVLPVGVIGSTWTGVIDGSLNDPAAVVISMLFMLLYEAASALYLIPFLTPFGAGWAVTYYILRRRMGV